MDTTHFSSPPQSYWLASTDSTDYPELKEDISVDTVIIGGGMAGILCTYLLQRRAYRVSFWKPNGFFRAQLPTHSKSTSQHDLIYDRIKNSAEQN